MKSDPRQSPYDWCTLWTWGSSVEVPLLERKAIDACRSTLHMKLERECVEREEFADAQLTAFKRRIDSGASKAWLSGSCNVAVQNECRQVFRSLALACGAAKLSARDKYRTMCDKQWALALTSKTVTHGALAKVALRAPVAPEPATRCFSPGHPLQRWTTPCGRATSSSKRSGPWSSERGATRRNTTTRQAAKQRRVSVRCWNNNSTKFCKKSNYDTCSDPFSSGISRACQFCGQQQKMVEPEPTGRLD